MTQGTLAGGPEGAADVSIGPKLGNCTVGTSGSLAVWRWVILGALPCPVFRPSFAVRCIYVVETGVIHHDIFRSGDMTEVNCSEFFNFWVSLKVCFLFFSEIRGSKFALSLLCTPSLQTQNEA